MKYAHIKDEMITFLTHYVLKYLRINADGLIQYRISTFSATAATRLNGCGVRAQIGRTNIIVEDDAWTPTEKLTDDDLQVRRWLLSNL